MSLFLVGAILLWAGATLALRPAETIESLRRGFGRRRDRLHPSLRARQEIAKPLVRIQGIGMAALGCWVLIQGAKLYFAAS